MQFDETNILELKEILTDDYKFEKEVIAFLNQEYISCIYIGITKNKKICGVTNPDELQLKIKDRIKNNILPSTIGLYEVSLEDISNKKVIKITIFPGNKKPYYLKKYGRTPNGCYIRIGSSVEQMTEEMIENLFIQDRMSKLDSIINIPILRTDLTFNYLKQTLRDHNIKINDDTFLDNFNLLTSNKKHFNMMANILADNNNYSIAICVFAGNDKTKYLKRNEYGNESLIKAINKILEYASALNDTFIDTTVSPRKEMKLFNYEAFKEAWINACVHNSWSRNESPYICWFNDRIEITSYGKIPYSLSMQDFLKGKSIPVNPELMRIFIQCGLVERSGHGVPLVVKEYGSKVYEFGKEFITVTIPFSKIINFNNYNNILSKSEVNSFDAKNTKNDAINTIFDAKNTKNDAINTIFDAKNTKNDAIKLSKIDAKKILETKILEILIHNPKITRMELAKLLNTSKATIERALKELKDQKKLIRHGGNKGGNWVVVYQEKDKNF